MAANDNNKLIEKIDRLRGERNAIILAHNYELGEIQDIADFTGDSLELSFKARDAEAAVIVFCGVKFMAETAHILSPDKTVLLPNQNAGCLMADMATAEKLRELKRKHPDATTVCYVNTNAEVKTECDVAVTSGNALKIVAAIPADKPIIFVPDQNLGAYIGNQTGREMILWPGYCPSHDRLTPAPIERKRRQFPDAEILIHPEAPPETTALADHALSTGGMVRHVADSPCQSFIIATEIGIIHRLRRENPDKLFIPASEQAVCPDMKMTRLEDVAAALEFNQHEINLPADIRLGALKPIEKMLAMS